MHTTPADVAQQRSLTAYHPLSGIPTDSAFTGQPRRALPKHRSPVLWELTRQSPGFVSIYHRFRGT